MAHGALAGGEALARAMGGFYRFMIASGSPDDLEALLLDARRRLEERYAKIRLRRARTTGEPAVVVCLQAAHRPDEAAAALDQAVDRCRRKKNLALARRLGNRLAELRGEALPA